MLLIIMMAGLLPVRVVLCCWLNFRASSQNVPSGPCAAALAGPSSGMKFYSPVGVSGRNPWPSYSEALTMASHYVTIDLQLLSSIHI